MSERVIGKKVNLKLRQRYILKIVRVDGNNIINIYGKIFFNNKPVDRAKVFIFHMVYGKKILLGYCTSNKDGDYGLKVKCNFYHGMIIGITSYKRQNTVPLNNYSLQLRHDIESEERKDIILYGKVINSIGQPVIGAIVAAFCEDDKLINHTFSDKDGFYMLNIRDDIYKDKRIKIRSCDTSSVKYIEP